MIIAMEDVIRDIPLHTALGCMTFEAALVSWKRSLLAMEVSGAIVISKKKVRDISTWVLDFQHQEAFVVAALGPVLFALLACTISTGKRCGPEATGISSDGNIDSSGFASTADTSRCCIFLIVRDAVHCAEARYCQLASPPVGCAYASIVCWRCRWLA